MQVSNTPPTEPGLTADAIPAAPAVASQVTLDHYWSLRQGIIEHGYMDEILWAQTLTAVSDPNLFWCEFSWVIINSGMKNQVAQRIWKRVRPAVEAGGSASDVFGHAGKARAIDNVYARREACFADYLAATDQIAYLQDLPWIGPITVFHLAKNLGHNCSKPDRHLERIAGAEGVSALCARLAAASGDRIATVDTVIWRAANLGLV